VSAWLRPRDVRRSSRATHYAVAAAASAWAAAGFDEHDPWRTGVVIGNVYGAPDLAEAARAALAEGGPSAVGLHLAAQACENAPSAAVAGLVGAHGPVTAPATACAAGGHAIGEGIDQIRLGRCDVVLAGAAQGPMDDALVASYHAMRIVSSDGIVRPFDRRRDGARFSEGAGVVVLESLDHARGRGATILAEALGHANTNDASNQLAGTPEPMARCLTYAFADAGLTAGDVAAVIGHGTATAANDRIESEVVAQAVGTGAPLTSIKRILGHGVATAGAWNAIAAVLALGHGVLPPAGLDVEVDPQVAALGLDVISGHPRPWSPGPILTNAFGLGGTNSALVFGPPPT
jgi:3-oxoacyl-(acyl-carrier-protein) synthase